MNDGLFPTVVGSQSPAIPGAQSPATLLSAEQIADVQAMLKVSVEKAEEAMNKIRELTGPQPGKIAQDMLTGINQGAGFLRLYRDSIEGMFRKWAKCRLQISCPHDHGFQPGPRDKYFCKRCDLQFTLQRDGTMQPSEIQL